MRHAIRSWALVSLIAWPLVVAADETQRAAPAEWQASIEQQIRDEEYHFSLQEDDRYWAPNRTHDLRAKVGATGLVVTSRTAGEDESAGGFVLGLRFSAWGRKNAMQGVEPGGLSARDERIDLDRGELTESYVNTRAGLKQGFTIPAPPSGERVRPLILEFEIDGGLGAFPSEDGQEVVFKTGGGAPVLRYAGLKVEDAAGAEVPARIAFQAGRLQIRIEDRDAVYPLEVDPLLTSPTWTAESNQASASFGRSVAPAGDVNGDGYADVIIGAQEYDNGQTDEGRAFVYHGSGAGLLATPAWTAESDQANAFFGSSVAAAGDIDGDGYADVIVGAQFYDGGQEDEGRAFVYRGSAAGLSASPAWTAESDQANAIFGFSVATAGDVDGDGYADVIVGAPGYGNGQEGEGRAFVYHGSGAGLSASPAWTAESDQAIALLGISVATAGDVNGDGYADVIVGASYYTNGQGDEGRALAYHGSAAGLSVSPVWTAESDQMDAKFGNSVAPAGDVNGDGYADVIIGALDYDNGQTNEGRAFVYHGSGAGLSVSPVRTAESDQANSHFGSSVATAGDVNGDGYADVVIAAQEYDNGQTDEGRAFVYHGSGAGLLATPAWTAESDQANAFFGSSVATAGDVNGDGYSDVIVGALGYDNGQTDEGSAFVYYGSGGGLATSSAWTVESDQMGADLGNSVATAGDVNGDGYDDVIVAALSYDNGQANEGRAFVYHGSPVGLSTSPAWTAESDQGNAFFGASVATAGDVNGDGYADVIVGADLYDNVESDEGRAFVYHGSAGGLTTSPVWTAESNEPDSEFGKSVAMAGDIDGDGYADVIVGSHLYDNDQAGEGRVFVYRGSAGGLAASPAWTVESDQAYSHFGLSVATAGDVNGDGYSDVIVGAAFYDNGQSDEGRAFVYHGSAGGLITSPAWTAESNQASGQFGRSATTAGDVNGDGYADVIVGAPFYDNDQTHEGRAFVYLGGAAGLSVNPAWTVESDQTSGQLGWSVATAGDVNGDGYSDVTVGAPFYDSGPIDKGRAFVYAGSAAGLSPSPAWTAESDQGGASLGISVATAGDVNGDGYADVIVGAWQYDNMQPNEGRAFVYYGNAGDGLDRIARQARADGAAPIAPLGKSDSQTSFRLRALGRTPAGRGDVRLEWERKLLGESFDGTGLERSGTATDTGAPAGGGSSVALDALLGAIPADSVHHWRLRILTDSPFFPRSPWVTLPHNGPNAADLRTMGSVSPQVIDVTPPDNAEGVAAGTNVVVRFSEDVRASTLTASTFRLLDGATPVPATLALSASRRLATLDSASPLAPGTLYTVQITSGVQDLAGNAALPFTSSFRVVPAPEIGGPLPDVSDATVPPTGAGASPLLGTAVAATGDLDGDGLADFLAGAPGLTNGAAFFGPVEEAGAAIIYFGSDDPAERISPDIIFTGASAHDRAGVSVASDFDFNGDGDNDLLIGAEQFDRTDPSPANHVPVGAGRAYLIFFDPTAIALYPNLANPAVPDVLDLADVGTTIPGVVFVGANLGDQVGFSVAGGGLLDAGQAPDLLIGAPGVDTPESGAFVNAGTAYGIFNDTLGATVNLDDVACTHLTGSPCAPAAEVGGVVYQGDIAGMQAGFSVGFVGALVDDGPVTNVWNAAVGAPGAGVNGPLSGLVMLAEAEDEDSSIIDVCAHGATEPGALFLGSQAGMQLGWSLADGRDAIADGNPDLLAGAPTYDSAAGANAGEVLHISDVVPSGMYTSNDVGTTIGGLRWDGAAAGDQLGYAVAGIGDVTGDGFDDVTLGAPFADPAGVADAGAVYVIAGAPPITPLGGAVSVEEVGSSVAGSVFVGTETGEHAGSSLAGVGDIDGGGNADFLVGAPNVDSGTGTVYIVLPDDGDNDGRADLLDCNPSSGASWDVPSEVRDVEFVHNSGSGVTTISWTVPIELGALAMPSYDTVRTSNPADFVGSGVCVETDGTDTSSTDAFTPAPGGRVFYLVVAQNSCGAGLAGLNSSGLPVGVRSCP